MILCVCVSVDSSVIPLSVDCERIVAESNSQLALCFGYIALPRRSIFAWSLLQGEFVDDIRSAVAKVLNTERRHLKTSFRDRGKYRSITLNVPVNSADQIYDVYAAIDMVSMSLLYTATSDLGVCRLSVACFCQCVLRCFILTFRGSVLVCFFLLCFGCLGRASEVQVLNLRAMCFIFA